MATSAINTFVENLYNTILQRPGKPAEIDFWVGAANAGMSATEMTQDFITSNEARNVTAVLHLYDVFFNRAADSAGLAFWVAALNNGTSLSAIAESFGASNEFQARFTGTSTADYVEALYGNLFGRNSDAAGKALWVEQIDSGILSRAAVALSFSLSDEALASNGAATHFTESYLVLRASGNGEPSTSDVAALASKSLEVALAEKITSYDIDSTAPLAPTVDAINSVGGIAPTTASVTAEANSTVTLFRWVDANTDGIVTAGELTSLGTATATGGTASFTGLTLANNEKLVATATDAAANTSTYSTAITVSITGDIADTTPPLAPTVGAVTSITGIAPTTASVTAEVNSTVALFKWVDANTDSIVAAGELTLLGTATAIAGTASFTGLTLTHNEHLVATATDASNNTSAYSTDITVSITDTTAPLAPTVGAVTSITGIAPTTASVTAETNSTVELFKWVDANTDSIVTAGELTSLGTATATGGTANFTGLTLTHNEHLVATATDAATNTSAYSTATTVSITDTTAPLAPIVGAVNSITGIAPTTASVTAEANSTVTLFKWVDANTDSIVTAGELTSLGTATATGGTANFTGLTLTHNEHLVATATDAATNTSVYSTATTVSITDTTAPTLASSTPADDSATFTVGSNLTLTFDEAVALGTGNIVLKATSGDSVVESFNVATGVGSAGGTVTVSGSTVTLNPFADLSASTDYNVRVDATAVVDTASNAYAGITDATTLNFTTAAPVFDGTLRTTDAADVAAANAYLAGGAVTLTLDLTDPLFRNHSNINLSSFGTDDFLNIKLQTSLFPVIAGWQKQGATAHVIGTKSNAYSVERYRSVPNGSTSLTLTRTVRLTAPVADYPAFTPRQISLKSWQTANYHWSARFFISGLHMSSVGHIAFI